jgi:hypothetical protein
VRRRGGVGCEYRYRRKVVNDEEEREGIEPEHMAKRHLYDDYVRKLSLGFVSEIERIQAEYGFEYGPEFEVALCRLLRDALPQAYGVCRGYVVDAEGNKAGDDIIIWARDRFPTLRMTASEDYSRKENIPIEAVYAYIEAKHSLVLVGEGPSSLRHSCEQVATVKRLVSQREKRQLLDPDPYARSVIAPGDGSAPLHEVRNPVYGAVSLGYMMVGAEGFEPPTSCSQSRRATGLRYAPTRR